MELVENPSKLPHGSTVDRIEEPYVKARIVAPVEYIGAIMKLGQERRGVYGGMHYLDPTRVEFTWEFPLAEIILDFYDKLKTLSRGYASLDYEFTGYRTGDLVRLDMLINGEPVDAFSVIIHRDKAQEWGRKIAEKLKDLIPRQLFEVVIQAAIGTKVIARETIRPLRKNVTAKCYGGDVTRKRKLLEKQREGKKRMKRAGPGRGPLPGSGARAAGRTLRSRLSSPSLATQRRAGLARPHPAARRVPRRLAAPLHGGAAPPGRRARERPPAGARRRAAAQLRAAPLAHARRRGGGGRMAGRRGARARARLRGARAGLDLGHEALALLPRTGAAARGAGGDRRGGRGRRRQPGLRDHRGGRAVGRGRGGSGSQRLRPTDVAPVRRADRTRAAARHERQRALASRDRDGHAGRRCVRADDPGIRVRPRPAEGCERGAGGAPLPPLLRPRPARLPAGPPQVPAGAVPGSRARRHRGDRCATSSGLTSAGRTSSPGLSRRTARSSSGSCRSRRSPSRARTRSWRAAGSSPAAPSPRAA